MDEIEDPTIKQPACVECGLPIRSQTFELIKPHHSFMYKTDEGMVRGGEEGIERPRDFMPLGSSEGWIHDDPRGVRDHRIEPQYFGPKHTHATDYERQMRNWRMRQMEDRSLLGKQFNEEG